jgi:hypothetical protein
MATDKRHYKNGSYAARIVSSTVGPSGKNGTIAAEIMCQVYEHTDHNGVKSGVESNNPVRIMLWLSDKNLTNKVLLDQLASLNLKDGIESLANNAIVGQELSLYCSAEDPNAKGEIYDKWQLSTGGGGVSTFVKATADKSALAKINAMLGFKKAPVTAAPAPAVVGDF